MFVGIDALRLISSGTWMRHDVPEQQGIRAEQKSE
jgi:hypothetical protein